MEAGFSQIQSQLCIMSKWQYVASIKLSHCIYNNHLLILVSCYFSVTNITVDEVDQALVSEVVEVSVVNIIYNHLCMFVDS